MIEVAITHALRDLAIEVAFASPARALALFGDSGAGKTSVLNAIAGLLEPQQGRIVLDGQCLFDRAAGISLAPAARDIGYVFQDDRLFPHLDVRANLLYGTRARRRAADDFAMLVDLLELGPLLARRPGTLSGGERQRVAIGRALMSRPRILLLDEPLTGLHREARAQVLEHLRRLKGEFRVASLLVTHQPEEVVALADQVVLLEAGRVGGQCAVDTFAAMHGTAIR
ncbi:MAG TPA: ATP-binding cassette domain-containing protein [Dokdonella sp.]|uniref:ATP-binding cassette domain-containing protein n=1 Tax=Dokdonella sp. TaxID=2291710 RepID=UPI0025BCA4B0|nr:ATP-binding cassette domain-containing protein [Dokdonella sp.]MBX3691901.1 ATP-binding cassette domain-containing protein [Dokdonella sp.]MCW5568866.1 ATP-binding cassette domain-containing protein [Dokdonella sp.]HNR90859.1 ATP-binding cassette domain-containing protein [Dokdonella sp.]